MSRRSRMAVLLTSATVLAMAGPAVATPSGVTAAPSSGLSSFLAGQRMETPPEVSETTRLGDRRSLVLGDRFYSVGAEDGTYPAQGWHTTGEMGGMWTQPIKLLDGLWFGVNGKWLTATRYSSGHGYTRMDLGNHSGVDISRVDVAPDGMRAGLIGLRLNAAQQRTIELTVDAHSELMSAYPWGSTKPSQKTENLQDTGSYARRNLVFRDQGTSPTTGAHDWSAVVGSSLKPTSHALGPGHRGPQGNVICPAGGQDKPCDDSVFGRGTGGSLTYRLKVPAGGRTVWFAIAGSDRSLNNAQRTQRRALANPEALLASKIRSRQAVATATTVDLPGDPQLAQSVEWSKQNIADSRQRSDNLQLRATHEGKVFPAPSGTLPTARWIGAGWPDYPWIFGTDGEYTAFAAVASGQFDAVKDHLRTLKDISEKVNEGSGKVVHEVTPDGQVYFGANADAGNTDETVKFPSAVALVHRWTGDDAFLNEMYPFAVKNMQYVYRHLDSDGDGWPEGAGNVERTGMGEEKLDNAVYAIRGLRDLAQLAGQMNDEKTRTWATTKADSLQRAFEKAWWNGQDTKSYADSLDNPGNKQVFQRYWTGVTPVEAELPSTQGRPAGPVADLRNGRSTVVQHESDCYNGPLGLYHTGTGATTDKAGNPGPTCDRATSSAPSDREVFTLGDSVMAVAEGALGRTGPDQMGRYTGYLATSQLDPKLWETPGAMPEIVPSPGFKANIDKPWTGRSMALQAWGTYGVLWPVVHYELGVAPDLGQDRVAIVPQIPTGQNHIAGRDIRVGDGSLSVTADRDDATLTTTVASSVSARLTVGVVLPDGARATSVTLDGQPVRATTTKTARGTTVTAKVPAGSETATVAVGYSH